MTDKVTYSVGQSISRPRQRALIRVFQGLLLLGISTGFIGSAAADEENPMLYVPSAGVFAKTDGTVFIQWAYPPNQIVPVGWYLERRTPSDAVLRVTPELVQAEMFSADLPVYIASDSLTGVTAGDHLTYRFIAVDLNAREWVLPFAEYTVETAPVPVKKPVEPAPSVQPQDDPPLTSGSRVRMEIVSNGLYNVSAATLAQHLAGFSVEQVTNAIAQTNLALSCGGEPVAWMADTNGAALIFYGQSFFNSYADRNVYWIDPGPGTNMTVRDGTTGVVESNQWFNDTLHVESNLIFSAMAPGSVEDDYWLWAFKQVASPAVSSRWSTVISLPDREPGQSGGQVVAKLVGYYIGQQHTRLFANGVMLDDRQWDGDARLTQSGTTTNLTNDTVKVEVEVRRDLETTLVLIDTLEVTYARRMAARNDQLLLTPGAGVSNLTVRGFSNSDIDLLDITDPFYPVRILTTDANEGTNGWRAAATVTESSSARYLAAARRLSPARIDGVTPAGWTAPSATGTPHLVIAPQALAAAAATLVTYRTQHGLDSQLVRLEDLYDEFSWGRRDPQAITLFLEHATDTWSVPPRYVCLAGDGHLDYHDYYTQSANRPNHIPPLLARVLFAGGPYDTYSTIGVDNPLADLDGDGIPDLAVGRLPARTAAGLTNMISRIITYEATSDWKNRVMFAADNDPAFESACLDLAMRIPADLTTEHLVYRTVSTVTMQTNFAASLNAGCPFSVYQGHCNSLQFGEVPFFKSNNIPLLTNNLRTSVMLIGGCQLNDFSFPTRNFKCLGAGFLDNGSAKGAVALWGTASENYLFIAKQAVDKMLEALFVTRVTRLGDMTAPAMEAVGNNVNGYAWIAGSSLLLGDPGLLVPPRLSSYDAWRAQTFSSPDSTNDAVSGPFAVSAGSGTANLLHFVYGTSPGSGQEDAVWTDRSAEGDEGYPRASFISRRWLDGVKWHWEATDNLATGVWQRVDQDVVTVGKNALDNDFDQIQIEYRQAPSNTVFLRLRWGFE